MRTNEKKLLDKEIVNQVNNYLKTKNERYEVKSYAKVNNKYIFTYVLKVDNPNDFVYTEKINNSYYTPVIDNTNIEYDIKTCKIKTINISRNLDMISKLKFININDVE